MFAKPSSLTPGVSRRSIIQGLIVISMAKQIKAGVSWKITVHHELAIRILGVYTNG